MPHAFTTGAGCGSAAVRSADKCCDDEKNKMIMAQRPKNLLAFISIKKSCINAETPGAFLREYFSRNCRLRYFDEEACVMHRLRSRVRRPRLTSHNPATSLAIVLRCVGRIATIVALCCAIGLHWIALQSFAWTTMIIDYSKNAPLCQAITQTFDGAHPCSLCHAVNTGKNSEKKSDLQSSTPKIDMICAARAIRLVPPLKHFEYASVDFSLSDMGEPPLVPPPRSLLS